jgi:aminoglycoside phosphotransferase (APT) family kinase protein
MAPASQALEVPGWVADALGPGASSLRRLPWGFTNESWEGTAPDGVRYVATRMRRPRDAAAVIRRGPEIARRLDAAGLATPTPLADRSMAERGIVVSKALAGVPGMVRLGDPDGPAAVGRALGDAWRRLARVDPTGLGLDDLWARPADLAAAAKGWLELVRAHLDAAIAAAVGARIDDLRASSGEGQPGFVHGDLVPANVLLHGSGSPVLLDLEAVRIGDPLLDVAWCSWIVRYHHPGAHRAAWTGFMEAAGPRAPGAEAGPVLAALPVMRVLEILANPDLEAEAQSRWLDQLRASADPAELR